MQYVKNSLNTNVITLMFVIPSVERNDKMLDILKILAFLTGDSFTKLKKLNEIIFWQFHFFSLVLRRSDLIAMIEELGRLTLELKDQVELDPVQDQLTPSRAKLKLGCLIPV